MYLTRFGLLAGLSLLAIPSAASSKTNPAQVSGEMIDAAGTVTAFYKMVFLDHDVKGGFARYVGPAYRQHNPRVSDGAQATISYLEKRFADNPEAKNQILRTFVSDDLVALHVHSTLNAQDRGKAIVDIFRVENGKIVEHWDLIQDVPEQSANRNGMF